MILRGSRALLLMVLVAGLLLLVTSVDVEAQCSMCRASLTNASNSRFVRGLNLGILVLLIPPVTIFCSLFIMLRRHRGNG